MKKILSTLFLCLATIVVVSSVQTPAFAASYLTKYIKKTSNVYSSTSKNKKKKFTLAINSKVKVKSATKTMYKVIYQNKSGYIYKSNTSYDLTTVKLYSHSHEVIIYNSNKTTKRPLYKVTKKNSTFYTTTNLSNDMYKVKYYTAKGNIIEGYVYSDYVYRSKTADANIPISFMHNYPMHKFNGKYDHSQFKIIGITYKQYYKESWDGTPELSPTTSATISFSITNKTSKTQKVHYNDFLLQPVDQNNKAIGDNYYPEKEFSSIKPHQTIKETITLDDISITPSTSKNKKFIAVIVTFPDVSYEMYKLK